MNYLKKILALFLITSLHPLSSCATSLWDENVNGGRPLYSDRTAFRRGDLITIVVNQSTSAAKQQSTETSKEVSVAETFTALIGNYTGGVRDDAEIARANPHNAWEGTRSFNGSGQLANTETLTSTIQARVTDVLPNNVFRVEASRRVEAGQETTYLVLTGLVRQQDLTTANTVLSTQVADLQLKQVGNGALSREQRKGWLTRAWEMVSPF